MELVQIIKSRLHEKHTGNESHEARDFKRGVKIILLEVNQQESGTRLNDLRISYINIFLTKYGRTILYIDIKYSHTELFKKLENRSEKYM